MPSVVRGHHGAAVHYKGAWPGRLCAHSISPPAGGRTETSAPSVQMEGSVLRVLLVAVLCCSGVFCAAEHRHDARLRAGPASRDASVNPSRYPLYMMQLYQSFRTADSSSGAGGGAGVESLQASDSVLSLTAGGESAIISLLLNSVSAQRDLPTLITCDQTFSLYSPASVKMLIRL